MRKNLPPSARVEAVRRLGWRLGPGIEASGTASSDNRTLFEVENAYNKPPPPSACIGLLNKVNFAQIKKIFYLGEIDLI
jgi:hypothetical protein